MNKEETFNILKDIIQPFIDENKNNIDDNIYNILHNIIDYDLFRYELFDV